MKAGDFDSDGDTDLLGIYNDNGVAKVHFFAYSESGFASPQEVNWLPEGISASQIKGVVKCGSGLAFLSSQGEGSAKVLSASAEASGSTLWDSACGAGSSEGLATTLVESMQTGDETLSYTYDAVGNITSVRKNGSVIESYLYDAKNQLIAVRRGGDLWEYTYDPNGNILSVTKNGVVEKAYTYGDANWKDKLTAFNGEAITYDAIGNPLQYRNGMAFTWVNGRKLGTITQNGVITTYTYDGDGNRIKKQSGSTTIDYIVVGGTIYGEIRTENGISTSIHYLFDENGTRFGFVVGGTDTYYYRFNLQGDVTGIFDATGTLIAEYAYDAWGKLLSVGGSNVALANLNPIRYRGYYYDTESGFYYLQSRYYDPEVCRFISPDAFISTGQGILGYNMYAYCGNNPVNLFDPSGCFAISLTAALTIGLVAAISGVVGAALSDPKVQAGIEKGTQKAYLFVTDGIQNLVQAKAEEKELESSKKSEPKTYYHATTYENALAIVLSSSLIGSKAEGGHVYAWKALPSQEAVKYSGARGNVIVSFKTTAAFADDWGICDQKVKRYGPVVSVFPGSITITEAKIIRSER